VQHLGLADDPVPVGIGRQHQILDHQLQHSHRGTHVRASTEREVSQRQIADRTKHITQRTQNQHGAVKEEVGSAFLLVL
jgi:hypothetical protein